MLMLPMVRRLVLFQLLYIPLDVEMRSDCFGLILISEYSLKMTNSAHWVEIGCRQDADSSIRICGE
jgi:hypothetical protein